jgi:spermidine synthase
VEVVEINPAAVPLAEKYFDFEPARVKLVIGDGRQFVAMTTNRYDVVVLDAFLGESPPSHLMTREAFAAMRRCLKPGGVLVMNVFGDFSAGRDFWSRPSPARLRTCSAPIASTQPATATFSWPPQTSWSSSSGAHRRSIRFPASSAGGSRRRSPGCG